MCTRRQEQCSSAVCPTGGCPSARTPADQPCHADMCIGLRACSKAVEVSIAEAVRKREALRMGRDVAEVDTWGVDLYTRRNIFDGGFGRRGRLQA